MFSPDKWFKNPSTGSFFSSTIDNSVRLVGNSTAASSARLTQTFGTVDSATDFTLNFWIKRNEILNPVNSGYPQFIFNFRDGTSGTALNDLCFLASGSYGVGASLVLTATNSASYILSTNNLFRDFSAWYNIHIMGDLNNGTASEKLKFFINGVEASYATDNRGSYTSLVGLKAGAWTIGDYYGYSYPTGSSIARWAFVDNSTLAASYFGEFKDGVWIPKALEGITWGSAGHLLEFGATGTSQNSSGIGADTSGETNHWAVANIAASDVVPDSPTNNFATLNPLAEDDVNIKSGAVLSEGNLVTAAAGFGSGSPWGGGQSTISIPTDKKIYCEMLCSNTTGGSWFGAVSIPELSANSTGSSNTGQIAAYNRSVMINGSETDYGSSAGLGGLGVASLASGDILQIAVDGATGKVWFGRNGTYFKSPSTNNSGTTGDPAAGSNEIGTVTNPNGKPLFIVIGGSSATVHVNFGQDSSFAGQKTAQGNSDGEGFGDFYYTPPTGYLTLCSSNMSDITIGPGQTSQADDYFDSTLYTGNGGTQSFVNAGSFQPDFVWQKNRSSAANHILLDSVRGGSKYLISNLTSADLNAPNYMTFNSDGATFSSTDIATNQNGQSYVAWNWKAGGTAVSNSDGSITSQVSAATDAGFSIVGFTSTGNTETVGHGLSQAPELYIRKSRSNAENWVNFFTVVDGTLDFVNFNTTNAASGSGASLPTSTVFSIGGGETNGETHVAYCFHSVDGYSKVGSYVGNGSTDGTFVFLGFRPSFVLTKESSATSGWNLRDNVRSPDNPVNEVLQADTTGAEMTSNYDVDFLSNGFKLRASASDSNTSGQTYIFLAFAESPFKFANAR
jgi:hypothetical protein